MGEAEEGGETDDMVSTCSHRGDLRQRCQELYCGIRAHVGLVGANTSCKQVNSHQNLDY